LSTVGIGITQAAAKLHVVGIISVSWRVYTTILQASATCGTTDADNMVSGRYDSYC
jgi:hypothetical protein